jgi:hypothetical protein
MCIVEVMIGAIKTTTIKEIQSWRKDKPMKTDSNIKTRKGPYSKDCQFAMHVSILLGNSYRLAHIWAIWKEKPKELDTLFIIIFFNLIR